MVWHVLLQNHGDIWHIADGFKGWYDIRWDAHPLYSYYQFALNIISRGWGADVYCLRPDLAAEREEPTVLRCRIYDAVGSWNVIQ